MKKIAPVRIQRSRKHKQVSPNGLPIVYCGRPGYFGNDFKVGEFIPHGYLTNDDYKKYKDKILTAEDAVFLFKKYQLPEILYQFKDYLKNKNLSCWCKKGTPCHVDEILKSVNSYP